MPALRITFLGTGTSTGIPMIGCDCEVCLSKDRKDNRLRSSILIESATTTIVIDTTPDFRYQMLRTHTTHLDAVVFTHAHKDHVAGLDDIRAFNFFSNKSIDVYANDSTAEALKREFSYIFSDQKYPGIPEIDLHIIDTTPFTIGDITLQPILVQHHKMPVYAYRVGDFTYITDANQIYPSEKAKIKGSKIVVVNALREEPHLSHFTLSEAIDLVNELHIPEAYFTHISHQLGLHQVVSQALPAHIQLAYDGLVITQAINLNAIDYQASS